MQKNKEKKIKKLYKTLFFIVAAIFIVLVFGTVTGLKKKTRYSALPADSFDAVEKNFFNDLGRIRALTADKEAVTAVIFPVLEYNGEDKAFQEELVQKKQDLRSVILKWFSEKSVYELYAMEDTIIKKELLKNINGLLHLSKVKNVYFKEFAILN